MNLRVMKSIFSKLPIRQVTLLVLLLRFLKISKLPIRQVTLGFSVYLAYVDF